MCILEAQVTMKVAISKTQPAQTTSKIKICLIWRIYVLEMKFRRSALLKPAQDLNIQIYLSTARTKLARKRRCKTIKPKTG
jgi:hypothetical protein